MQRRAVLLALLAMPSAASAHSLKFGIMRIGHAWALPSGGPEGTAFLPIVNTGEEPDALIAARAEICDRIELRESADYASPGTASFAIEPDAPLAMRPGTRHLRLLGLKRPLAAGQRFPLILDFLNLGEAEVDVHVEATPGT